MVKNIVIVNDFANTDGGAGKVAVDVALELSKQYNVFFFTSVKPIDVRFVNSHVRIICVGKPDILSDTNRIRAITKGLFDSNVRKQFKSLLSNLDSKDTIVHVHTWTKALTSAIFEVTSKMNFHLVLTLHDYFIACPNGGFFNYKAKRICDRKSLSVNCLLSNCDVRNYPQKLWRVLRLLIQKHFLWRNKKLTLLYISDMCRNMSLPYIPNNVDMIYLPDPVELGNKAKVDVSTNECYLYLGRLSPEKGAILFCEAISDLRLKGLIVGDGYLKNELEVKYPHIEFVGWASGKKKELCLRRAKALVFPSFLGETYGLVVAEAKSYGIPCIVPDRCAASEQIEDGKTGYVFKTGDLESLKEAIMKYENTDLAQMQKNLLESFHPEELSMETHLKRLVGIYNEILENDEK